VVIDGNYISTAGVTAGLDGSFKVTSILRGDAVAEEIQLDIEYAPEPPFHSGTPETALPEVIRAFFENYGAVKESREAEARRFASVAQPSLTQKPSSFRVAGDSPAAQESAFQWIKNLSMRALAMMCSWTEAQRSLRNVSVGRSNISTRPDGTTIDIYNVAVARVKATLDTEAKQKRGVHSRQQDVVASVLRTANYLDRFCAPVFDQHGITSQQFNVLRILRGAGFEGLPTLDIADRMIEQTPGITRLLDRLEQKRLVRRERPAENRRQVLCYITKPGLDLLQELDIPLRNRVSQALHRLDVAGIEELIRLLELARGEQPSRS
jgi:DNA-binding MarR family transcriptional regulator